MSKSDLVWFVASGLFAALSFATLILGRLDARLLDGAAVWSKPFKFAISLAIYFLTFGAVVYRIPAGYFRGSWPTIVAYFSIIGGVAELGYIYVQAARGRHSHFNRETRIEAVAFTLMGLGAVLMLAPAFALGTVIGLFPPANWPVAITLGTSVGLLGGAVLTVVTASRMGAVMSHFANGNPASSRKMWLTGWSIDGSDLRPSHFAATHMMQALPIAAVGAQFVAPAFAVALTLAFAALWTAITLWLFRHALRGGSLTSLFMRDVTGSIARR